jgi:hypothetical protein
MPVLYMNNGSSTRSVLQRQSVRRRAAATIVRSVVGDAESTDGQEFLQYTTDGSAWTTLVAVPPINGSQNRCSYQGWDSDLPERRRWPDRQARRYNGTECTNHRYRANAGRRPTDLMFAVRFHRSANKSIGGWDRSNDQFTFHHRRRHFVGHVASGTTSGTGNGPFTAANLATASGVSAGLRESMTGGSATLPNTALRGTTLL